MKEKKKNYILIFAVVLTLLFFTVGSLVSKDVSFSENENRYLEQKPELSIRNILGGKFETDSEQYLNDQIIGREKLVRLMSGVERLLGICDINGTYVMKDGRLIQKISPTDFDWDNYQKNLGQIADLSEKIMASGKTFYTMLVPSAQYIYSHNDEYIMSDFPMFDEDKAYKLAEDAKINLIDLRDTFITENTEVGEGEDGIYYMTDHHWTDRGASVAFSAFIMALNNNSAGKDHVNDIKSYDIGSESENEESKSYGIGSESENGKSKSFNVESESANRENNSYDTDNRLFLTDDFRGTLFSKVLLDGPADTIRTSKLAETMNYSVEIEGEKYDSLLFTDRLDQKDKYQVFFGGNYGRVDISSKHAESRSQTGAYDFEKSILIIKDSYANSFVPYLLQCFGHITMVDTRYFRDNISELSEEYDICLVLYSINNFASEGISIEGNLLQ